eukprot:812432-Prorocentrum_minimum.AAC.2
MVDFTVSVSSPCGLWVTYDPTVPDVPPERALCGERAPRAAPPTYQTYRRNVPFAGSEHLELYPGLGHTSSMPFDRENGWYRGLRGLAGGLTYTARTKNWSPDTHHEFPPPLRQCVQTALM